MTGMTIWAETIVSAAHDYMGHGMHGHSYIVRVYVKVTSGDLSAETLSDALRSVKSGVDHTVLNVSLAPACPTMENLARWFHAKMKSDFSVVRVTVIRPEGIGCEFEV